MGCWQAGVGVVFVLALGVWSGQWSAGAAPHAISPIKFSRGALDQASQLAGSTRSLVPSNSGFAPRSFPTLFPVGSDFKKPQDLMGVQSKDVLQGPVKKLTWHFPSQPERPQQPDVLFEMVHPVPANSVAARCGENFVHVEVKKDFFGTGIPRLSSSFSLGGCTATGEDRSAQVLIFESELHACGSTSMVTKDALVYLFSLIYTPQDASYSIPIFRTSGAVVGIECRYPRMHNVSSNPLMPTWLPYAATFVGEELLFFSLKLMTDDWRFERPSHQYSLGDLINIEASVRTFNHIPFRVFVESCVATSVSDTHATLRYSFIENNGCLVDAKLTGSVSRFIPRTQMNKLQFQLETFRFQDDPSGLTYITCVLKVAAASSPTNVEQKACSFVNRWVSADEDDRVCGCCDGTCGSTHGSGVVITGGQWDQASVGPIRVKGNVLGPM